MTMTNILAVTVTDEEQASQKDLGVSFRKKTTPTNRAYTVAIDATSVGVAHPAYKGPRTARGMNRSGHTPLTAPARSRQFAEGNLV
jgi:hypothetical protein